MCVSRYKHLAAECQGNIHLIEPLPYLPFVALMDRGESDPYRFGRVQGKRRARQAGAVIADTTERPETVTGARSSSSAPITTASSAPLAGSLPPLPPPRFHGSRRQSVRRWPGDRTHSRGLSRVSQGTATLVSPRLQTGAKQERMIMNCAQDIAGHVSFPPSAASGTFRILGFYCATCRNLAGSRSSSAAGVALGAGRSAADGASSRADKSLSGALSATLAQGSPLGGPYAVWLPAGARRAGRRSKRKSPISSSPPGHGTGCT